MDAGDRDGIILKLQKELAKLKEVYRCSADSHNWVKSEKVCRCTDQEFDDLVKTLSANELQAGILILQRHIDLEHQITKCLENLKAAQSGWDGKSVDVTQKIITSQSKIARLRSRLLRCITQQLYRNGTMASDLPPWTSSDVNTSEKLQEANKVELEKEVTVNASSDETGPPTANNSIEEVRDVENSTENGPVYATVSKVPNPPASSAQQSLQKQEDQPAPLEIGSKDATSKPEEEKENDAYETIYPKQPSRPAPQKPPPYSLSKKLSQKAKDSGDEKSAEKAEKPMDSQVPAAAAAAAADQAEDEEDAFIVEHQYLQNWDPTPVLQELFGNVRAPPTPTVQPMEAGVDNVRMAGYMEKQPVRGSMKRASVFKGWKKRHFKAVAGKLYYYEDHRALEPLGFINLVGCSVKKVDDKLLEVAEQQSGGRSVKLKCSSVKEAEDWKEALKAESAVPVDSSQVPEESSATEGLTIIIDLGSNAVKAGFAQEDAWPQVMFPCVIAVDKEHVENCKYGHDALLPETRKKSKLYFPLRKSLKIDKLKVEILDLIGILEHVFDKLKVDPSKHKVIMTLPHGAGPQEKEELVELLLDHFQMEACYLQEQAILAMYSYSAISGIVVDIGDHIDIFPVVEGCMVEAGVTRLPYGGRQITDSFTRMLTEKGVRFFSEVESYISRAIKEKVSFVAKRGTQEDDQPDTAIVVDLEKYSIPDGTSNVTVDTARYRCTEGLFKPSVWGKDNPGIHELTVKAIMACSIDIRKQMCRNIYLSGGGSMSAGLAERLQEEVSELMPLTSHVQVHAGLERQHAAYIGASVVAKLPLFEELCVFKEDWDVTGPEALEKWSTL